MKGLLNEKRIQVGAYCSPQPGFTTKDGTEYPSRINEEIYRKIAALGVTVVYGHAEAIGRDNEEWVFKALKYAEKAGIKYFVRDIIAEEYVSLGFREFRDWRSLSEEEKEELDKRFSESIRRYKDYPAFAGISFYDEPGYDSFEGIAAAQAVFLKECPDKIFYVNNLPNNCASKQLQYGACPTGVPESDNFELAVERGNGARYTYFIDGFMQTVRPHLYSYDSYPFLTLGNADSMVHISLYELQQICVYAQKKYGVPYWTFMQVGGQWEGSANRVTDYAEMLLQINISLAYGAKGLQLFPLCFPNDWVGDDRADAGAFDVNNEETPQYHYLKLALKQVEACGEYLSQAELKSVRLAGAFNGLLPPEEELRKIEWNETIFRGVLPECKSLLEENAVLPEFTGTSQFFIGCFDYKGRELYYVVNNSIAVAANLKVNFGKTRKAKVIYKGKETSAESAELNFGRVAAGDGLLILL